MPLQALGAKTPVPSHPSRARLETFPNPRPGRQYEIVFSTAEFTSLCPVTGQPDFATITLRYIPNRRCVESKSLKLYLHSFRNVGSFAEAVTNRILDDLVRALAPRSAVVTGEFAARGGIALKISASFGKPA
ncbi:MAG: NADPH-dependent 7-cyano-7-deazaguanine reductase QueF [Verrucomicrobia bacterium]|nr:NADPH-dependent 7-cyano-7-deazaguanine reductase QueF [Verrucomicrobiota bacterium]NBR64260.1 NADPH-dependent 7-cyano-7-deazaguanine reductase QueF [Verrucomicrobiota bacterium]